ncbi:MAG: elongation factor P [Candidatus Wallbacteria bacterium]|nr:elongation factor P [Candidatus Wallbacteria bacterium]
MISTNEFRNGITLEIDNELWVIVDFQHVKPGKGAAFTRTRLKNIRSGLVSDKTYKSGEKFQQAHIEDRKMQYLYNDGEVYHFMDGESYEQFMLDSALVADASKFLLENMEVHIKMYNLDTPIGVELPNFVELVIAECEPAVKGDSVNNVTKKAKMQTGCVVNVPLFISQGEKIRIDTRTGEYIGRA